MIEDETAAAPLGDGLLEEMRQGGHERLLFCNDERVGLQAVICIHSTRLGPANGGVRMLPYPTTADAARDAMRLARAMTYKWAAAGENRGGGKSVIVGDPRSQKSEALLRRFGQFVDELRGGYYVGEDVGITLADMEVIHLETDYVATLPIEAGGVGDIAPATARGTVEAMRACVQRVWGTPDLAGRTVALQGLGACGRNALSMLLEVGARVWVTDIDPLKVTEAGTLPGVTTVEPDDIYDLNVDVFAPYALGGVINDETIPRLKVRVVAGSANNIFAEPRHGDELERRGIVYAVDYIANAGGAIYDAEQFRKGGFNAKRVERSIARIFDRTREVFAIADRDGVPYYAAADRMAERRLAEVGALQRRS
jgi:leucine dehydrogenase